MSEVPEVCVAEHGIAWITTEGSNWSALYDNNSVCPLDMSMNVQRVYKFYQV